MTDVLKGEGATLSADGGQVLSRNVPLPVLAHFKNVISTLTPRLEAFFKEEKLKRRIDEMQEEVDRYECPCSVVVLRLIRYGSGPILFE